MKWSNQNTLLDEIGFYREYTRYLHFYISFFVCNKREHSLFRFSFLIQFSSLFVGSHSDFRLSLASELLSLILLESAHFHCMVCFHFYNVTRFKIQKIEVRIDNIFGIGFAAIEMIRCQPIWCHQVRLISNCKLQNGHWRI